MNGCVVSLRSEADTDLLGRILAETLPVPLVIGLQGTLGAGKTRLVKAVAAAKGIDPRDVVSPTFVLCQQYDSRPTMIHYDAYRLADTDEFLDLGFDEALAADAWIWIEWSDRVAEVLPEDRLEVTIEDRGGSRREITLAAGGPDSRAAVNSFSQRWSAAREGGRKHGDSSAAGPAAPPD